jgi:nicotinamidase-related amidase
MPDVALLVLDLQRDFLEDAGRMPIARAQVAPLLDAANATIDAAAARHVPIVYIVNAFPRSQVVLNFFRHGAAVAGTPGADMDPRVHVAPAGTTIPKERSDAFTNPALDAFLRERGVKRVGILGVFAPHCVRATARGAMKHGYGVTVVRDGLGAASDGARDRAVRGIENDGAAVDGAAAFAAKLA